MARPRARHRTLPRVDGRRLAAAVLVLVIGFGVAATRQPIAAATDRLPDLRVAPLSEFRIVTENGRRLLKFTAMMVNAGPGHFEVRGRRDGASDPTMSINQVIYDTAGTSRQVATTAEGRYSGDGHDHWHVQRMMSYVIWPAAGASTFVRGTKVGFCFLDTDPWNLSVSGARRTSYYRGSWCGTQSALTNRVGISTGWGDTYRWSIAYQYIDITGLAAGEYYVRSVVDEPNFFLETNNGNNCTWTRIRVPASGTTVTPITSGATCLAPASATAFPGVVTYSVARRITLGAGEHVGYRFAANGAVITTLPTTLPRASGANVSRTSTIPGQAGTWHLVANGIWAGYWMRETAAMTIAPLPASFVSFPGTAPTAATSRVTLAAGSHYGFRFTESGGTIQSKWYPLGTASGANVDRRGTLPGRSGTWVHIANGIWADYWMPESERAVFSP
jgi:hypothetical protein